MTKVYSCARHRMRISLQKQKKSLANRWMSQRIGVIYQTLLSQPPNDRTGYSDLRLVLGRSEHLLNTVKTIAYQRPKSCMACPISTCMYKSQHYIATTDQRSFILVHLRNPSTFEDVKKYNRPQWIQHILLLRWRTSSQCFLFYYLFPALALDHRTSAC